MDAKSRTAASKFLSYVLRHEPTAVGIALDSGGWVAVDVLLDACAQHGRQLSRAELDEVVATSPKQRFAFSDDGQRIRANQGHSITVDLRYEPAEPPDVLHHGTVARLLPRFGTRDCSGWSATTSTSPPTRPPPGPWALAGANRSSCVSTLGRCAKPGTSSS